MATIEEAVLALRHVVQEHGDEGTELGEPADGKGVRWFGQLLGWEWPSSYVEMLERHNGVVVQDAIVFKFLESIDLFLRLHESWHRPDGYWPVASDGCGNYFALALGQRDSASECPVVYFDMMEDSEKPQTTIASSYPAFIMERMQKQCEQAECSELAG